MSNAKEKHKGLKLEPAVQIDIHKVEIIGITLKLASDWAPAELQVSAQYRCPFGNIINRRTTAVISEDWNEDETKVLTELLKLSESRVNDRVVF